MPSGNFKADEVRREQRRKTVAANLVAGLTIGDIAEALGVHKATVYQDIKRILQRWREEQVDLISTQRMLDIRRIDRMINALWGDCQAGKLSTVDRMIKLLERRAKLLGLDAPAKVAPTTPDGTEPYDAAMRQKDVVALAALLGLPTDKLPGPDNAG